MAKHRSYSLEWPGGGGGAPARSRGIATTTRMPRVKRSFTVRCPGFKRGGRSAPGYSGTPIFRRRIWRDLPGSKAPALPGSWDAQARIALPQSCHDLLRLVQLGRCHPRAVFRMAPGEQFLIDEALPRCVTLAGSCRG
jgi:hypothetical protein